LNSIDAATRRDPREIVDERAELLRDSFLVDDVLQQVFTMLSLSNAHQLLTKSGVLDGECNLYIASRLADQLLTAVAPNR
jgi:hypothetical protein